MQITEALIVTDDDLVDVGKGFDFLNLKKKVLDIAINTDFIFFNGTLVKNRIGPI